MAEYQLVQCVGADMASRYTINGRRVSREEFDRLRDAAHAGGILECFQTKARQMPGGKIRRTNYSIARIKE